jgi:hypothetical protein
MDYALRVAGGAVILYAGIMVLCGIAHIVRYLAGWHGTLGSAILNGWKPGVDFAKWPGNVWWWRDHD